MDGKVKWHFPSALTKIKYEQILQGVVCSPVFSVSRQPFAKQLSGYSLP